MLHVGVTSAVTAHLKSGHDNKLALIQAGLCESPNLPTRTHLSALPLAQRSCSLPL